MQEPRTGSPGTLIAVKPGPMKGPLHQPEGAARCRRVLLCSQSARRCSFPCALSMEPWRSRSTGTWMPASGTYRLRPREHPVRGSAPSDQPTRRQRGPHAQPPHGVGKGQTALAPGVGRSDEHRDGLVAHLLVTRVRADLAPFIFGPTYMARRSSSERGLSMGAALMCDASGSERHPHEAIQPSRSAGCGRNSAEVIAPVDPDATASIMSSGEMT